MFVASAVTLFPSMHLLLMQYFPKLSLRQRLRVNNRFYVEMIYEERKTYSLICRQTSIAVDKHGDTSMGGKDELGIV